MNREGKQPADLQTYQEVAAAPDDVFEYEDVTGAVELPAEKRRKKRKSTSRRRKGNGNKASGESKDLPQTKRGGRQQKRRKPKK
jgi:hypothetical protein